MNERLLVRRQKWCWLAIAALLWCSCAAALDPGLTIKQLVHTAWGPREGAPLGGVQALAQTNDGFLWLRSSSSLYRFDGIAFEQIELPQDAKLASTDVLGVFAPHTGGLWVSVYTGGVAFLRDGRWNVYGSQDGLPPGAVSDFAEKPDGTLWVATTVGFGSFDGVRWRSVGADMGLPPAGIVPLFVFVDGQGTLWLGASGQMFTLRAGERQFSRFAYSGPMPVLSRLVESSEGTIWYDTDDALVKIHQNPTPQAPASPLAHAPAFDHDGTLWDITHEVLRINPERLRDRVAISFKDLTDRYSHTDGLTGGALSSLLVDREGNVWVATAQGLDRFANPSLEAPMRDERNRNALGSVTEIGLAPADGAGGLWVTDTYGAVQRYQDGRLATPPALKERIACLVRTDDGTVWFGGRNILWRERQGRFESVLPPGPDGDTQALAVDKSGGLWASIVRSGVFYLKDSVWTPYGGIATLPRRWAITIVRDRRDRLWFSYLDGTAAVLDGDQVRTYGAAEGLQIGFVAANYSGRNDQWLGGEFGLARFDGERFHGVRTVPELSLARTTGIVETAAGDLWLNGQSGITHLTAAELQRSRFDSSYRVNGETFGAFDGVVGNGWMRRPLPTAIEAGDGKIWFATSTAFFGVDPERLVRNRIPPPVVIRALTVGDHRIDPRPGVMLPVRATTARFDYAGLSLTEAQKVRYRYRLDGFDTDWREVTAARQALYSNLRPGDYTFRVIAANNDGVWNDTGAALAFTIPPAFVQTGWFIALCVVGGAAAVWTLVRLRVRQVRRRLEERMEERLNERTRIARDLHDTLLQSIQGLLLRFQTAYALFDTRPADAKLVLGSSIDQTAQAITEGRDAVQNLRSSPFDDRDLATSLSALGTELGAGIDPPSKPQYHIVVQGRPRELTAVVRDEAYRIAREAVSNAYQHAKAAHIETEVTFGDADLFIRVRDDGIGVYPEVLARGQRHGHWGLPGMRERSESLEGHLHVWSEGNAGTEVELRIPAHVAYAHPGVVLSSRLRDFFWPR